MAITFKLFSDLFTALWSAFVNSQTLRPTRHVRSAVVLAFDTLTFCRLLYFLPVCRKPTLQGKNVLTVNLREYVGGWIMEASNVLIKDLIEIKVSFNM